MAIFSNYIATCDGADCTNEQGFMSKTGSPEDIGNGWVYAVDDTDEMAPVLKCFCPDCAEEFSALNTVRKERRAARVAGNDEEQAALEAANEARKVTKAEKDAEVQTRIDDRARRAAERATERGRS